MLSGQNLAVKVHEVLKGDSTDPSPFESVVVLASIHAGRHQGKMAAWVKANASVLNNMRTAFLSVSLSNGSGIPKVLDENRRGAESFAESAGWTPDRIELVAGCLQYPAYSFLNRFLMKRMAKSQGLPLDTSRDHEYTDWESLEAFAKQFAASALPET